jgi:hypothetical protein
MYGTAAYLVDLPVKGVAHQGDLGGIAREWFFDHPCGQGGGRRDHRVGAHAAAVGSDNLRRTIASREVALLSASDRAGGIEYLA